VGFASLTWRAFRTQSPLYFFLAVALLAAAAHKLYGMTLMRPAYSPGALLDPTGAVLTVVYVLAGGLGLLLPLLRDVRRLGAAGREAESYRRLWAAVPEPLLLVDPADETILDCNESALELLGRTRDSLVDARYGTLEPGTEEPPEGRSRFDDRRGERVHRRESVYQGEEEEVPVELRERILDLDGRPTVLVSARDISVRKRHEAELRNLTFRSQLTGLPSREALLDRIRTAGERARRREEYRFAVIVVRLDVRTDLSELSGFNREGRLLERVSDRLKGAIREMDELAHVDDRVFAVLLEELKNPDDELIVARRIHDRFEEPFDLDGEAVQVDVTLGLRTAEAPETSADLLAEARQAMLEASKRPGWTRSWRTPPTGEARSSERSHGNCPGFWPTS